MKELALDAQRELQAFVEITQAGLQIIPKDMSKQQVKKAFALAHNLIRKKRAEINDKFIADTKEFYEAPHHVSVEELANE